MPAIVARQCIRKACSFRFPGPAREEFPCPKCGAPTSIAASYPSQVLDHPTEAQIGSPWLEIGLDNLRSALNVGSVFRTSDGAGVKRIHLIGICPPPTHPEVKKTALGADETIPWLQHWDGVGAVAGYKAEGYQIWSLEKTAQSVDLFSLQAIDMQQKILLVVGNENAGVDPGILEISDRVVHLPMIGNKESLNVASAFAIAVYWLKFGLPKNPNG